jgi:hypothetical protein
VRVSTIIGMKRDENHSKASMNTRLHYMIAIGALKDKGQMIDEQYRRVELLLNS